MSSSATSSKGQVTVLAFTVRKPGIPFAEFKSYYEDKHVPWVTSLILTGDNAPLSYTRSYIDRGDGDSGAKPDKTRSFPMGGASTWDYDCVVRSVFRDEKHRDDVFQAYLKHGKEIREDEDRFTDVENGRVVFVTEICGE